MKTKHLIAMTAACIALGSCSSTQTSQSYLGTMAGAQIGGTIGEAIGWMATGRHDGPQKAMLGSIVGTAAGAVIGNSIASKSESRAIKGRTIENRKHADRNYSGTDEPAYEAPYRDAPYETAPSSDAPAADLPLLTITNLTYQDENGDGKLSRNETINVVFDVTNTHTEATDVTLIVDDPYDSNNLAFSPSNTVNLRPGGTIRYTAKMFCKSKPRGGKANIVVTARSNTAGTATARLTINYR